MKRVPVIRALPSPGVRTDIAWAVKKKRTESSNLAVAAQLAFPRSGSRPSASGTSARSSHNEEPRRQSSDAGQGQLKCYVRRKVYTRRKFQQSCVPAAAAAAAVAAATSILPKSDCEVDCDDGQDATTTTTTAAAAATASTTVEESEESAPSSASPKAWKGQRSTRRKRDVPPPPVLAGVAGTIRKEDGTNGSEPEAEAAAAADVSRPQRQRKPKVFRDYVNTSTAQYDWLTYYPGVPFPEDYEHAQDSTEQLGEVETIATVSEGVSSDISDSADKPFSLKLQTDIQKTCKARRILVEDSLLHSVTKRRLHVPQRNDYAPPAAKAAAAAATAAATAANPPPPPKESSSSMCPQTPDKFQESNGECEVGDRTPATPSESAAATDDDKDSSWTASDDDSTRNVRTRVHEEGLTFEFEISGRTPEGSRLLQNGFRESVTFNAKIKLKKKRPRPKVWRPEKVKVAKPVKIPKSTINRKQHRPARVFEHNNHAKRAAAVRDHCLRATASAEFVEPALGRKAQSSKRQRQNERPKLSSKAADSAAVPTAAEVPGISIAAEAIDSSKAMVSDRCTILDLTSSMVPTMENRGPASEQRAECSPALEQELLLLDPGASELTMEKITSESDLLRRSYLDVYRCIPNFGGVPVPEDSDWMEEPPSTPQGNTLAVLPASIPFLISSSFTPNQNFWGGGDSSDSDGEKRSPTPTRRKRSTLTQRTRRSLLSAVELAAAAGNDKSVAAPLCVSTSVLRPAIPFFKMTEEHRRQHALALCQDPRFFENPMELVVELIKGTPEHLRPTLWAQTNRLVIGILKLLGDVAPVDNIANQLACREPSPASPFPLPLQSRESDAQEPLQLVVYAQKSSDMVVYQGMRPKVKYKPRVNLDRLTISTFERLMLQGGEVKDTDRADEDWVEERKLWSDRAHHFNGIMRQVQGDRAFSKWGGSVLDSVVGTFLTQNVSDFLSSNAFMALRAHFPAREDARTGTDVPTEEQSSLTEKITPGGCSGGTSVDIGLGTPRMAGEHVPMEGSKKVVDAAGTDNQQENTSPMPDAGIQDGQVVTEVSMKHTCMTTLLVESQEATVTIVNSPSRDEALRGPDQLDPYSLSGDDWSAETLESRFDINDLVIRLGAAHLGSTSVVLGSCSSMKMTSTTRAGIPDEPVSANVYDETLPVAETMSEVPRVANPVQGSPSKAYHFGTQAAIADDGEKRKHSDLAAQPGKAPSSKKHSMLEDKFRFSFEEDASTPDGTEKVLAAALRAILGKQTTGREEAGQGQRMPLKPFKRKKTRNNRLVDINRFKTNVRFLSGGERANYELKVNYKLNSEQRATWEALRADVLSNKEFGRDPFTTDSVDWEAVRRADVVELANVIKERGMNNILSGRIKSLLDRIHRDQDESLDLEWVRKLSPINAQNFLTSVRGLGIKSVECIRLLTLHHPSFPVDTNVGRIVVRLGWVPLEPLPEETQLHLLEMYPVQEHIQKYIWPRLCTLDQQTLYEFHYQLITFGKVFCTKSKPNCNACPMRSQCKHYESAYCSARPLLKGPEDPSNDTQHQIAPLMSRLSMQTPLEEMQSLLMLDGNARASGGACIPIIEEPDSPEYVPDIEDISFTVNCTDIDTDYVEHPDVNLEFAPSACDDSVIMYVELNETSTQNVSEEFSMEIAIKGAGQESEGCIEDVVEELIPQVLGEEAAHPPSQELVLLPPEAASFPAPPLKNVQRLRTIHYVYELPDHHPLLAKMDKRDPEDPCFYLLAIWTSDEVPEAMPKISDDDASNPFACCQSGDECVRGTLLVPCRTAMKGSFPLNGTYFQVNEVFADHGSSIVPVDVPRTFLWNLKRRFVYFGTSVTSIFKDMSQEEIQCCFQKGYICVRALDQTTRQPKLLAARLHQSGAKIVAARAVGPKGRRASKSKMAS